jgi:hypothetical protein
MINLKHVNKQIVQHFTIFVCPKLGTSKTGFGQEKIMNFVLSNKYFFSFQIMAFGQVGEKN